MFLCTMNYTVSQICMIKQFQLRFLCKSDCDFCMFSKIGQILDFDPLWNIFRQKRPYPTKVHQFRVVLSTFISTNKKYQNKTPFWSLGYLSLLSYVEIYIEYKEKASPKKFPRVQKNFRNSKKNLASPKNCHACQTLHGFKDFAIRPRFSTGLGLCFGWI